MKLSKEVGGQVGVYAKTNQDGTQLWAQVNNSGKYIFNGGLNKIPKIYNEWTGFSVYEKPSEVRTIANQREQAINLNEREAYIGMCAYLSDYYYKYGEQVLDELIDEMTILSDGSVNDSVRWEEWLGTVQRIKDNPLKW